MFRSPSLGTHRLGAVLTVLLGLVSGDPAAVAQSELVDLGTLGGRESSASAINNSGQVTGWAQMAGGSPRAFLYSGGQMTDLGAFGGAESGATAINNSGQVAGWAQIANGNSHSFFYSGGEMTDLGTFGGSQSGANVVNDSGQVAGWAQMADVNTHAFLYSSRSCPWCSGCAASPASAGSYQPHFGERGEPKSSTIIDIREGGGP